MDTPHAGRRDKMPADRGRSRTRGEGPRSLIFVSPAGGIPVSLIEAVEHEFQWVDIALVSELSDMDAEFESPVALFLVDSSYLSDLTGNLMHQKYGRRHPYAATAIVFEDIADAESDFPLICRCDFVRGVLPMNLKLDVWLSVLGLLLRGGEYFPTSLLKGRPPSSSPVIGLPTKDGDGLQPPHIEPEDPANGVRDHLTVRELEVAEMMARGAKNKGIAADLGLSEHTVKIHVGNIMRKLRARNRTEAVANLLRSAAAAGGCQAWPS